MCVGELLAEGDLPDPAPNVELVDPSVARLFSKSTRAHVRTALHVLTCTCTCILYSAYISRV